MKNKHLEGWEGWVIESIHRKNVFLSRNKGYGSIVLAIDDHGVVRTTQNRVRSGWEEFEMSFHKNENCCLTFQRVKEPRYYLSCTDTGNICSTKSINLDGWEAWIPN